MEAHKDMRRKSGETLYYHPLEVALVCVEGNWPWYLLYCGSIYFHDVVEDT